MSEAELERMNEEGGDLQVVSYLYEPESPKEISAIRLGFIGGEWLVQVNEADSTLEVGPPSAVVETYKSVNVSTYFPWAAALGKHVRWAWWMENQRGYEDALQLEFADTERGGLVRIQLLAVNVAIQVNLVTPLETPYLSR
jgi:hypothetical protein